jgi:hypothetical protein
LFSSAKARDKAVFLPQATELQEAFPDRRRLGYEVRLQELRHIGLGQQRLAPLEAPLPDDQQQCQDQQLPEQDDSAAGQGALAFVRRNCASRAFRTLLSAARSDQAAWNRALRPKLCKLACRPVLSRTVSIKLRQQWSPEQTAGWLKRTYPGELENQVSHETIYRSLFIQARGVLKKERLEHLGAKRTIRRSKHASLKRNGLGQIKNALSIRERPASIEDRAVPGHWEGELIDGSRNTYSQRLWSVIRAT